MNIDIFKTDLTWKEKVAALVKEFSKHPQSDLPLKHYFAPHVYIREIFMPAGSIVIGKIHKTEHFNIIQRGRVSLIGEGDTKELIGPVTFTSQAGVQKVLYIHEDTVWSTVHVTDETDTDKLHELLTEPEEFDHFLQAEKRILEAA